MQESRNNNDFYAAGFELRKQIRESHENAISTRKAQALLKDYLPHHEEIQEALHSIIARPSFAPLLGLPHRGGAVALQHSLIESLRKTYSEEVVFATEKLINGLLSLDEKEAQNQTSKRPNKQESKSIPTQEHRATKPTGERASPTESNYHKSRIRLTLFLMALGITSLALASTKYYKSSHQAAQGEEERKASLQTQRDCPIDLNANPTTVANATEVTLTSKGVRWAGIGYLGGLRELHNGPFTGEKTFQLKGGIEISTDNPKALYVRFGNCPAIPMQRASYQQLRGRWDYGPKPANDPSCIPGNEGNPLLLNCLPRD
jgi:hypothetical protein